MSTYPLTAPDTIHIDVSRYYTLTYYPPGNLYKFLPNENVEINLRTYVYTFNGLYNIHSYYTSSRNIQIRTRSESFFDPNSYQSRLKYYTLGSYYFTNPLFYAFDFDVTCTNGIGNINYNRNVATTLSEHTLINAQISDYSTLSQYLTKKIYFSTILNPQNTSFIVNKNNAAIKSIMFASYNSSIYHNNCISENKYYGNYDQMFGFHLVPANNKFNGYAYSFDDDYNTYIQVGSYSTNIDLLGGNMIPNWMYTGNALSFREFYSFFTNNSKSFNGTIYTVSMTINRYSETKNTYYGYKTNGAQTTTYSVENG